MDLHLYLQHAGGVLYGAAVARVSVRRLVPSVYGLFAASFAIVLPGHTNLADQVLLDKSFYVWISLFSLFHISVFWFHGGHVRPPAGHPPVPVLSVRAPASAPLGTSLAALLVGISAPTACCWSLPGWSRWHRRWLSGCSC